MFDSSVYISVVIDLLIVLVSTVICCVGFYLGHSIRRQENKIDNLVNKVGQHDRDIAELKMRFSAMSDTSDDWLRKIKKIFHREAASDLGTTR